METPGFAHKSATRFTSHPGLVLLIAAILSGFSIWAALEIPFYTSRKALLPHDTDVSRRLDSFLTKFGAASDLILVVEGAERSTLETFASELTVRLRKNPLIREASEKVDLDFFFLRAYLLAPAKRLSQFESILDKLIGVPPPDHLYTWDDALQRVETWLDDPPPLSDMDVNLETAEGSLRMVMFFLDEWLRWLSAPRVPEGIDWQKMLAKYGGGAKLAAGKGYFSSHDGKMLFVFVRPMKASEEFEFVDPFIRAVRQAADELQAEYQEKGKKAPRVGLAGLPAVTHEEFLAIQHDIAFTITTAAVLILLLIGLWLRSVKWALVVFVPMGLGVLWNIGLTYLIVGHLTLITSAFTAILFGLGVDYGIFMSTRIMEERNRTDNLKEAIASGVAASFRALLTAGGATVLIFGSLTTVPFSGFADMGMVAACGVLLVLLSTFVVQPALYVLMPPSISRSRRHVGTDAQITPQRGLKLSRPVNVLLVVVALGGMGAGIVAGFTIPFNYDVLSMLPEDSEAAHYQRRMVKESDYQAEVLIFTAKSIAEARKIATAAARLDSISQVQTITDLFPPDAAARIEQARRIGMTVSGSAYLRKIMNLGEVVLHEESVKRIRSSVEKTTDLIEDSQEAAFSGGHKNLVRRFERILDRIGTLQKKLDEDPERARVRTENFVQTIMNAARKAFEVLEGWKDATTLTPDGLPSLYKDRFFAADGTVAIYAFPAKSVYNPDNLAVLMKEATAISKNVTGFPTTHQVFSHMAVESFRRGTIMATIVAILWILLILRRLRGFIVALLPLLMGGGWMLGILALTGTKFSYANIIALPLVMGLAVDYGVWYAHRRRERRDLAPWQVAMVAGRAILLAAGTTLAGLGAITLASYKGIASMGISVTIGLLCCVVTALLVSPAISELFFGRRK